MGQEPRNQKYTYNTQSSKNRTPLLKTTHLLEGLLREVHTLVNDHTRKQETTKNLEGELFGERPGHVLLVLVCMICHKAYISDNVGYRNSITEADVFRVHDGPKGLTNVTRESHLFSCSSKYYKYNINRPRISIVHVVHTESNNVSYWDSPYLMYNIHTLPNLSCYSQKWFTLPLPAAVPCAICFARN